MEALANALVMLETLGHHRRVDSRGASLLLAILLAACDGGASSPCGECTSTDQCEFQACRAACDADIHCGIGVCVQRRGGSRVCLDRSCVTVSDCPAPLICVSDHMTRRCRMPCDAAPDAGAEDEEPLCPADQCVDNEGVRYCALGTEPSTGRDAGPLPSREEDCFGSRALPCSDDRSCPYLTCNQATTETLAVEGTSQALEVVRWPGGWCSPITRPGSCGRCWVSREVLGERHCFDPCDEDVLCRDGYVCDEGACIPGCQSDLECQVLSDGGTLTFDPASGRRCEGGRCVRDGGDGAVGDVCNGSSDCGAELHCLGAPAERSGYLRSLSLECGDVVDQHASPDAACSGFQPAVCTRACTDDTECGAGSHCHRGSAGVEGRLCVRDCEIGADTCPSGQRCAEESTPLIRGGCLPGSFTTFPVPNLGIECPVTEACWSPSGHGFCGVLPDSAGSPRRCHVRSCAECPDGATCIDGYCLPGCSSGDDCPVGLACADRAGASVCVDHCDGDEECGGVLTCFAGETSRGRCGGGTCDATSVVSELGSEWTELGMALLLPTECATSGREGQLLFVPPRDGVLEARLPSAPDDPSRQPLIGLGCATRIPSDFGPCFPPPAVRSSERVERGQTYSIQYSGLLRTTEVLVEARFRAQQQYGEPCDEYPCGPSLSCEMVGGGRVCLAPRSCGDDVPVVRFEEEASFVPTSTCTVGDLAAGATSRIDYGVLPASGGARGGCGVAPRSGALWLTYGPFDEAVAVSASASEHARLSVRRACEDVTSQLDCATEGSQVRFDLAPGETVWLLLEADGPVTAQLWTRTITSAGGECSMDPFGPPALCRGGLCAGGFCGGRDPMGACGPGIQWRGAVSAGTDLTLELDTRFASPSDCAGGEAAIAVAFHLDEPLALIAPGASWCNLASAPEAWRGLAYSVRAGCDGAGAQIGCGDFDGLSSSIVIPAGDATLELRVGAQSAPVLREQSFEFLALRTEGESCSPTFEPCEPGLFCLGTCVRP